MATADKLVYLDETKDLLREAINAAGGSLTELDPFRDYADQILWGWLVDAQGGLDLDYVNDRYRVFDPAYNALVEKPWADIVNNYSAPAGRTYWDESGILQTAGANEMIRAFDPATGEFLGNQIWGSYKNEIWPSDNDSSVRWIALSGSVKAPASSLATPVGGNSTNTFSGGLVRFNAPALSGAVRAGLYIYLVDKGNATHVSMDYGDGPVLYKDITGVPLNTWHKFEGVLTAGSYAWLDLNLRVGATVTAATGWTTRVSGVQAAQESVAGPYINTAGSAVTIAAENQIIDGSVFSDFWNPAGGTLFIECSGAINAVALKAAGIEVIVDSASNKKYAVAYTSDPAATSLIIGANLNGYIRRIVYFRKELPASLIARLIA